MKLDFSTVLRDFTGDVFTLRMGGDPLTLEDVFLLAINTPLQTDATMSLSDKLDIARLGKAIYSGKNDINVADAQINIIKDRISIILPAPALILALEDVFTGEAPVISKTKEVVVVESTDTTNS